MKGKKLIRDICDDLEILSLDQYITTVHEMSAQLTSMVKNDPDVLGNDENLLNSKEIQKLILEVLAKYGELSLQAISYCVNLSEDVVGAIIERMIKSSLILRVFNAQFKSDNRYQLNHKYFFIPIKNIESNETIKNIENE